MKKYVQSGNSKILIEDSEDGMGIYYTGPDKEDTGNYELDEAKNLLQELIDYLGGGTELPIPKSHDLPGKLVNTFKIHENSLSWTRNEIPYIWKNQVIVSRDSLEFFTELKFNLEDRIKIGSAVTLEKIHNIKRLEEIEKIINGLYKALGRVHKEEK